MSIRNYEEEVKRLLPKIVDHTMPLKESFKQFYKGNQGISFKKGDWIQSLSFDILADAHKETSDDFFIFCDQIEPIFNKNLEVDSMYIRIHKDIVLIPTQWITHMWNAGYPRAGYLIETKVLIPWERLKPLYQYIHNEIDIDTCISYYEKNILRFFRVQIDSLYLAMYDTLKENLHHKKEVKAYVKKVFDALYKKEMDILEEALKFSVINPMYQGIIIGDHDVFKDFKNPFVKYVLEHEGKFSLRG
jgi:hypothetical protein